MIVCGNTAVFISALYQVLGRHQPSTLPQAWYTGRYENSHVITCNYYLWSAVGYICWYRFTCHVSTCSCAI